jgi:hypothetical protein
LILGQIHANRFDIAELKGIYTIEEDLYVNRTLAIVNNIHLIDNYQRLDRANPFQNLIWTITFIVFVPSVIGVMIYIGRSMRRDF